MVQGLRLRAFSAGGAGSILGQGAKVLHAAQHGQKVKINFKKSLIYCHAKNPGALLREAPCSYLALAGPPPMTSPLPPKPNPGRQARPPSWPGPHVPMPLNYLFYCALPTAWDSPHSFQIPPTWLQPLGSGPYASNPIIILYSPRFHLLRPKQLMWSYFSMTTLS